MHIRALTREFIFFKVIFAAKNKKLKTIAPYIEVGDLTSALLSFFKDRNHWKFQVLTAGKAVRLLQVAAKRQGSLKKVAQQFLLMWSCFGTRVIRDMTLHSAPSFGKATPSPPTSKHWFSDSVYPAHLSESARSYLLSLRPQGYHPEMCLFSGHTVVLEI